MTKDYELLRAFWVKDGVLLQQAYSFIVHHLIWVPVEALDAKEN